MTARELRPNRRSIMPTAMADAFLAAIVRWARAPHTGGVITIPSGEVSIAELVRVVLALKHFAHRGEKKARLGPGLPNKGDR